MAITCDQDLIADELDRVANHGQFRLSVQPLVTHHIFQNLNLDMRFGRPAFGMPVSRGCTMGLMVQVLSFPFRSMIAPQLRLVLHNTGVFVFDLGLDGRDVCALCSVAAEDGLTHAHLASAGAQRPTS